LTTSDGVGDVPKYTSYEVAPVDPVQVNVGPTATSTLPFAGDGFEGATNGLELTAVCVIVKVCPAIIMIPVRWAPGFAEIEM
jgi:hypothetical protein